MGTHLNRDEELRYSALHEAVNFLTFRTSSAQDRPRLADVRDVTARLEHYIRTGDFPLEQDWSL